VAVNHLGLGWNTTTMAQMVTWLNAP